MSDKLKWMCSEPDCERPATRTGKCESHESIARKEKREASKPVKQQKPLKRTSIKKVSDKRKDQNSEYSRIAYGYLKDNPKCACCGDPSEEVHHKKGRTNDLLLECRYWLPVCRPCHTLITEDSAWAIREGYSLPRNGEI